VILVGALPSELPSSPTVWSACCQAAPPALVCTSNHSVTQQFCCVTERYVYGYAKEAQRRLMNAQATVHAVASGSPPTAIAPSMLYTSMCPYTDGSSPL
jgi:hypothetical protein